MEALLLRIEQKLDLLLTLVATLGERMAIDFTGIQNEVAALNTVEQSVEALLGGLTQQVKNLGQQMTLSAADQAKLDGFVANLETTRQSFVAAVTANTPVAPTSNPAPTSTSATPPTAAAGS